MARDLAGAARAEDEQGGAGHSHPETREEHRGQPLAEERRGEEGDHDGRRADREKGGDGHPRQRHRREVADLVAGHRGSAVKQGTQVRRVPERRVDQAPAAARGPCSLSERGAGEQAGRRDGQARPAHEQRAHGGVARQKRHGRARRAPRDRGERNERETDEHGAGSIRDGPAVNRNRDRRIVMTRIGFIGVGTMGLPMAKNLVKKGFAVTAYDVNPDAVKGAAASGMTAAASAAEAVATADIVITMLPSSPQADAVFTGDGGVLAAARKGTLCVDMSTIDPGVSRRIAAAAAERDVRFIDAPVSGGVPRATDGTLAIMVGGAAEDFAAALPALQAMGANVIHVGPVGSGEVVKLCNNLIAGVAAVAVSEAFRIAEGFGVDLKVVTEVISKSSGHTWLMENMHPVPGLVGKAPSSRDYAPGFTTDLMAKDLGLAVNAARELRVPVVVAPAAQQALRLASSHGLGRKDFSSVYMFLRASSREAPV